MRKFIPDFILKNYSAKIFHGNFNALVMFCDITGFTNMTEELMKNGKEGLEVLTDLINSVFSPAIEIVQSEGGFISSFAGDAFTAIFPMDKPLESDISRSLGIADKIRNSNSNISAKETRFGIFGLSTGNEILKRLGYGSIKAIEPPIVTNDLFLYVHKKNAGLIPEIVKTLQSMKQDGSYQSIIDKYLGRS